MTHNGSSTQDEFRGMGSVEYAAVQAYGARLNMKGKIDETN